MKITGDIIEINTLEFKNLVSSSIALGIKQYLLEYKDLPRYISKNQAYERYSRRLVDRWIKEGLVKEIKDGDRQHKIRLDSIELEKIAAFSNRTSFYRHREICK
jgi:hypothetical protein